MEEMYKQLEAFTPQELQMLEDAQTLEKMQQKAKKNWHRAQHPLLTKVVTLILTIQLILCKHLCLTLEVIIEMNYTTLKPNNIKVHPHQV